MTKLNRKDILFILFCILLFAGTFWYSESNFYRAFPEASINFNITKKVASANATNFLNKHIKIPDDYRSVTIFTFDNQVKVFVERTLGLKEANKIFGSKLKLWRWSTRWFCPLKKEEFTVEITPSGEVCSYTHLIKDETQGANLTSNQAYPIAKKFLENVTTIDLKSLDGPEIKTEKLANRTDHTFTWTKQNFHIGEGLYEYKIIIQGNKIGGFSQGLQPPENWIRSYSKLRSLNLSTGFIDVIFSLLTFIGLIVIFVLRIMSRDISWRLASVFAVVTFVLSILNSLNSIPNLLYNYETTESFSAFIVKTILQSSLNALVITAFIFFIVAAAESLYRAYFPSEIALINLFSWKSIRSKKFFIGIIIGYTMTGAFLAYQIIFYLIADRFGAWSPADIPYSDIMNTAFPWIAVLTIGFLPAVSEEFFFRAFSIPFFHKLFRFRFIAIIIPAVIWGFGHSGYPNQPFYIRGLEVSLAGIVIGILLLKYGILPLLVWHYTVDAGYTAMVLFHSNSNYFKIMAIFTTFIMLIPFIVALIAYLIKGAFSDPEDLKNSVIGTSTYKLKKIPKSISHKNKEYLPFNRRQIIIILFITVIIISLTFSFLKYEVFQKQDFSVSPMYVQEKADYILNKQGGKLSHYKSVIYIAHNFVKKEPDSVVENEDLSRFADNSDLMALTYILQHGGIQALKVILKKIPDPVWAIRYYQPEKKEEFRIFIDAKDGHVIRFTHLLAKNTSSAQLEESYALKTAQDFLTSERIDFKQFTLKSKERKKQKSRYDYSFIWEKNEPFVSEAHERIFFLIRGDRIGEYKRYVHIPENWVRNHLERNFIYYIRWSVKEIALLFFAMVALWGLYIGIVKRQIDWGTVFKWALFPTSLHFLSLINSFPVSFVHYNTAISYNTFLVLQLSGFVVSLLLHYVLFVLLFALIDIQIPLSKSGSVFNKQNSSRDAILITFTATGIAFLFKNIIDYLVILFPKFSVISSAFYKTSLALPLPILYEINQLTLILIIAIAFLAAFNKISSFLFNRNLYILFTGIILSLIFVPLDRVTQQEFLLSFSELAVSITIVLFLLKYLFKDNVIAYILTIITIFIIFVANDYFSFSNLFFRANGLLLIIMLLSIFIYPIRVAFGKR